MKDWKTAQREQGRDGPGRPRRAAGFTLIELIGVLAIVAILAGVLAPNVLRSIERAAVAAEQQTLAKLGDQVELYVRDTGSVPGAANWTAQIAAYSDLAPADILVNRRRNTRVLLLDPATSPSRRILILSSMRAGLALPTAASINTAARFDGIWQTPDGSLPPSSTWNGWNAWAAVGNSVDFLLVERVNLVPLFLTGLKSYAVTLNHRGGGGAASYNVIKADGTVLGAVNVTPNSSATITNLQAGDTLNLYLQSAGRNLAYSYVISSTGMTFDFDGTNWTPR